MSAVEDEVRKPNSDAYDCQQCGKLLYLTPTEILKHRRQHSNN